MGVAEILLLLIGAYVLVGLVFGLWFVLRGVQRDPAARAAGLGFRLLILPGSAALWPLLLTYRGPGGGR